MVHSIMPGVPGYTTRCAAEAICCEQTGQQSPFCSSPEYQTNYNATGSTTMQEFLIAANQRRSLTAVASTFRELWHYKELLYFMIWRDLKVRYKQTALGALWAIIVPTMTMVVFTIFFGRLAQMPSDGIPYPAFSYSALLPWTYFSQALSNTGNCVVTNTDLVTKVYFPRLILPLASVISGFVDFLIASTVLLALFIYYDIDLSLRMLLVLPMMIPVICCALGAGALLAIVNVR